MDSILDMGTATKSNMNTTYQSKKPSMMIEEPQIESSVKGLGNSFFVGSPEISELDEESYEEIPPHH